MNVDKMNIFEEEEYNKVVATPNLSFDVKDYILRNLSDISNNKIGLFLDKLDTMYNKNQKEMTSDDLEVVLNYVVTIMPTALNYILKDSNLIVSEDVLYNAVIRDPNLFLLIYENGLDTLKVTIAAIERKPELIKQIDKNLYNKKEWRLIVNAANNTKPLTPLTKVDKLPTRKYPKELNSVSDNKLKKEFIEKINQLNISWNSRSPKIKKIVNDIQMFYAQKRIKQKTFIELIELLMSKNGLVLNFINKENIDDDLKDFQDFSKVKIKNQLIRSKTIQNMEESDLEFAVSTYGLPLTDILNQGVNLSDATFIKLIKLKPANIRFVPIQKESFCLAAVKTDGTSIEYINKPSEPVQIAAIKKMIATNKLAEFYNTNKEAIANKFNLDSQNIILRKVGGGYSISKPKKIKNTSDARDKADDLNKGGGDPKGGGGGGGSLDEIRNLYKSIKEKINKHLSSN